MQETKSLCTSISQAKMFLSAEKGLYSFMFKKEVMQVSHPLLFTGPLALSSSVSSAGSRVPTAVMVLMRKAKDLNNIGKQAY